jgi:FKBP-type peptidyl-prolyl cis-trans isomerase
MKLKWMIILGVGLLAADASAQEPMALKTEKDRVSYGIGVGTARNFKRQGMDVDLEMVVKGLRDELLGAKLLLSEEDLSAAMTAFQTEMKQKQEQAAKKAAEDNKKAGEAFLAKNKAKEGVVTLSSGLQYKILKAGNGKKPAETDTVECQFRAALLDGTEFDGSNPGSKSVTFAVKGAIPGWKEALKLMPVGSRWQLFVPPQLAYGEKGAGGIGPNATLIFELELISIHASPDSAQLFWPRKFDDNPKEKSPNPK